MRRDDVAAHFRLTSVIECERFFQYTTKHTHRHTGGGHGGARAVGMRRHNVAALRCDLNSLNSTPQIDRDERTYRHAGGGDGSACAIGVRLHEVTVIRRDLVLRLLDFF